MSNLSEIIFNHRHGLLPEEVLITTAGVFK